MSWLGFHRGDVRTTRHSAWSVCSGYPNTVDLNATFQRSNPERNLLTLTSAPLDTGSVLHLPPQRSLVLGHGRVFAQSPFVVGQLQEPKDYDQELFQSVS